MNRIGYTAAALSTAAILVAAGLVLFVESGIYDVSAIRPHTAAIYHLIKHARDHSVSRRSEDIQPPPTSVSDGPKQLTRGLSLFREHCVRCHGAPGVAPEPFALGLQPLAIPLAYSGRNLSQGTLYWIVKNGLKMTAMPAFEFRMNEHDLWAVVAFLQKLPTLTPVQYKAMKTPPAMATDSMDSYVPDVSRGRAAIGQYSCTACHQVPGMEGPESRVGPTLHGIGSRAMLGGVLPNSIDNMALWIRSPQSVAPLTAMPELGVTERDAQDMAAFLSTLK
jgi:mono/diheme cytochrome c family protein